MKKLLLATTMLFALASGAHAVNITSAQVGQSGTQEFDGRIHDINDPVTPGLGALITFTLNSITTGNVWNFGYTLTNTSTINGTGVWGFGFNTDPNLQGSSGTGLFNDTYNPLFVLGVGGAEFCANSGNSCFTGASSDLGNSLSSSGTISLDFENGVNSISLTSLFVLYQGVGSSFFNPDGHTAAGLPTGADIQFAAPQQVPGPVVGALLPSMVAGFGMLGLNYWRRRRFA